MATICSINSSEIKILNFMSQWIDKLKSSDPDTSMDEFRASVESEFGNNSIALNQIQQELNDNEIEITLDLPVQKQMTTYFHNWELKDSESEIRVFGTNTALDRLFKHRFEVDAIRYTVVNTRRSANNHLVDSQKQLKQNISDFKDSLIKTLLTYFVSDPIFEYYNETIFNSEFGADGEAYDNIMYSAHKYLKSVLGENLDLSKLNLDDKTQTGLINMIYYVFALNNFDYLFDNAAKNLVEKSTKQQFGDLNRTDYLLMRTLESEQQDIRVISEQSGNAMNYVTPSVNKIISSIPKVRYRLGSSNKKIIYDSNDSTLQLPHVLQLGQWIQLYLPDLTKNFKLESLDLYSRPIYTVKTVFKALHDAVLNYKDQPKDIKDFLKKKNTRDAISVALSLYEYLFAEENERIDKKLMSIEEINGEYGGTPNFNIINELIQQLIQAYAPAYIEHNQNGTIYDLDEKGSSDTIKSNYIQKFELSRTKFSFLNPLTMGVFTEGLKDNSEIAEVLIKGEKKSFANALQSKEYLDAACKLLGITEGDKDFIKSLLKEADEELNGRLHSMFTELGKEIRRINIPNNPYDYLIKVGEAIDRATSGIDYDIIGSVLGSLIDSTPSPTFISKEGNQQGIYRTTSLVSMFDHLRKKYKKIKDSERKSLDENKKYIPIRERSNIFVSNPGLISPDGNTGYLSSVAIPLTMGEGDNTLDARKQPEFIQDLHAFVGEYMSLMLGIRNNKPIQLLAFQLGTYSDKTTLPQLVVNGKSKFGQKKNSIDLTNLLKDKKLLLRYIQAYQSTKSIDLVNHILEDWKELFSRFLIDFSDFGSLPHWVDEKNTKFIEQLLTEGSELRTNLEEFLSLQFLSEELINSGELVYKNPDSDTPIIDFEKSSHQALFANFISNPGFDQNSFIPLMKKTEQFRDKLLSGIESLNKVLEKMPKSFLRELVPILAAENSDRSGLKIVENLYADSYKNGLQFNKMVIDDLIKDCSIQEYSENPTDDVRHYYSRMAKEGLEKEYIIDGERKSFIQYLSDFFINNSSQIELMIEKSSKVGGPKIFNILLDSRGNLNNTKLEENLSNLYFSYLTLTNFLRHQALDLSVKEAYVDKGANDNVVKERSKRQATTTKRNNTLTAPIIPFQMDLVNGVSKLTKICVIEDTPGGVFNTIGTDRNVDEFDGLGFNSPIQVRMEDVSLNKKHRVSTKKTFITPVDDYASEELKWASNEITNKKIRESRGSQRNLLSIFKRMHSIPFNYNITKLWKNSKPRPINIRLFLGKDLYAREGFKYYKYESIKSTPDLNTYIITRYEVDRETGEKLNSEPESISKQINTIYEIYDALNGVNCMELTKDGLDYSENIMDFLYKLVWSVGEKIDPTSSIVDQTSIVQPLRDAFIGILATHSSNKRGAANIVTDKAWTNDSIPLSYYEIDLSTGGEQLSAEHDADGSTITKGTQLMQDIAQKGYTSELVENVYKAIAKVMDQSSPEFDELVKLLKEENTTGIQEKISEKIVKQLEILGTNEQLQNLIARFKAETKPGESFILPLSLLARDVIKSYAPDLNKEVIKQKDSGLMGTLNGSSGFIQLYNLGDKTYTFNEIISQTQLDKFKEFEPILEQFCSEHNIPFDEVIRKLSLLDLLGQFDQMKNYYTSKEDEVFDLPKLLQNMESSTSRKAVVQSYFAVNPDADSFFGFKKISVSESKPGITVIDPHDPNENHLIDSSESILNLQDKEFVLQDLFIPSDLQPSIFEIETESGLKENEYTSFEAILGARINRYELNLNKLKEGKDVSLESIEQDEQILIPLLNYIGKFDPKCNLILYRLQNKQLIESDFSELRKLQEDIQNFKNHIKSFGYTLKFTGDFDSYFKGFNPRKYFEHQLQENILREAISNIDENGNNIIPRISDEDIIRALKFYIDKYASPNKKEALRRIFARYQNGGLEYLIKEHPQFLFKILPFKKELEYKRYFDSHPQFDKIVKSKIDTAQIIMPSIYRGQMRLGNIDLIDVDFNFFKKAPTFYNINKKIINKDGSIDVDFIVRTFRGQYNIVVADDLLDPNLDKYGKTLTKSDIVTDEEGYRIDRRNKSRLYKLPSQHSPYIIKKDGFVETIIIKSTAPSLYQDINNLLKSDEALVSVQPFIANLINSRSETNTRLLLRDIQGLNTIPEFDDMFEKLDDYFIEKTITKEDLAIQLGMYYKQAKDGYEQKYRNSLFVSFLRSLDVIATRIPTQNMSSIMTMKIAAFTKQDINDVFVTKWQQWLQGADYDIDKAFILGYNFDDHGRFITWSAIQELYDDSIFETSLRLPLPSGKSIEKKDYPISFGLNGSDELMNKLVNSFKQIYQIKLDPGSYTSNQNITTIANDYNVNLTGDPQIDFNKLRLELLVDILNRLNEVGGIYVASTHEGQKYFRDLKKLIDRHNTTQKTDAGYKNYATYQMHRIMNDPRNSTTAYKSIDIATAAFNDPIGKITEHEQVIYNLDNGHTISSITVSGAVGKDDVGIGANGTKGQFTLLNYFNRIFDKDEPLDLEELTDSHYFNIGAINLTYQIEEQLDEEGKPVEGHWNKYIGPISDTVITDGVKRLYEQLLNGESLYIYDRDASQDVGALLSKAVDNAKDLSLDKMNALTDYFAMHIFLAMIGCPPEIIIRYFRSDAFVNIINSAKNDLAKGNIPLITYDTFVNAKQYELAEIFACAKELTALAQILSINQGLKVEEEEIVGQKQKLEKAYHDALKQRQALNPKSGVSIKGLFNEYMSDPIYDEYFGQFGSVSKDIIIRRMIKANNAMQKVGITLETQFDFNRFKSDPDYAEAIKCIFDVVKHHYNIFDVIDRVPHFAKMFQKYNELMQIYTKACALLNFEINIAPKIYNKSLVNTDLPYTYSQLRFMEENPDVYISKPQIPLPDVYRKDQTPRARQAFLNTIFNQFFLEIGPELSFEFVTKSENNKEGINIKCDFKTDEDVHKFIDFVNMVLIPNLFTQNQDNTFLQGLTLNKEEMELNGNVFLGFNENLRTLENAELAGITRLHKIKEDFKKIKDIKLIDLVGEDTLNIWNKNATVGDFLYLYNNIIRIVNPRGYDFGSLFTSFDEISMQTKHYKFVAEIDKGIRELNVDPHIFMAYMIKDLVKFENGIKQIKFTDGTSPLELQTRTETEKHTTYLIGLPKLKTIDKTIEFAELLKNALLNNKLIITEISDNCE